MIIEGAGWTQTQGALLALLLAGHFVGDFLLQTRRMAVGKRRLSNLAAHAALIGLAHLVVALPLLSPRVTVALVSIVLLHAGIDALRARAVEGGRDTLWLLALDQASHVAVLLVAWSALVQLGGAQPRLAPELLGPWVTGWAVLAAFAVNATGGSAIVRLVLGPLGAIVDREATGRAGAGHLIGILERTITLILILAGQWAAMALLATAKSVARFDDLKDRRFAEYYLVGTLTSLLVAILVGLGLQGFGIL